MKRIIKVIPTVCLMLVSFSTLAQDDCEKDISTNPDQPFNNHSFPSNKYNPWINSDFEKGFTRAEVIKYDDYLKYGSEPAVKEAGKMGVEGKEYIVEDGDIMHFRFNV